MEQQSTLPGLAVILKEVCEDGLGVKDTLEEGNVYWVHSDLDVSDDHEGDVWQQHAILEE